MILSWGSQQTRLPNEVSPAAQECHIRSSPQVLLLQKQRGLHGSLPVFKNQASVRSMKLRRYACLSQARETDSKKNLQFFLKMPFFIHVRTNFLES